MYVLPDRESSTCSSTYVVLSSVVRGNWKTSLSCVSHFSITEISSLNISLTVTVQARAIWLLESEEVFLLVLVMTTFDGWTMRGGGGGGGGGVY